MGDSLTRFQNKLRTLSQEKKLERENAKQEIKTKFEKKERKIIGERPKIEI